MDLMGHQEDQLDPRECNRDGEKGGNRPNGTERTSKFPSLHGCGRPWLLELCAKLSLSCEISVPQPGMAEDPGPLTIVPQQLAQPAPADRWYVLEYFQANNKVLLAVHWYISSSEHAAWSRSVGSRQAPMTFEIRLRMSCKSQNEL
jgi:hypothetical protein